MRKAVIAILFIGLTYCSLLSCSSKKQEVVVVPESVSNIDLTAIGKPKLSDYGFFKGDLKLLQPNDDVIPYTLNSALFTDYAHKQRFVKVPKGNKVDFSNDDVLKFPEGTILIKNFFYPADFSKPTENIRMLETRLLLNEGGSWKALPYIWNEEQTEAYLDVAGKTFPVSWKHLDGNSRTIKYSVPNMNQCKGCHQRGDKLMPIGPTARQLNGDYNYSSGKQNQLVHWQKLDVLINMPDINTVTRLASYEDATVTINERARAWLEINCAHCHRADGPAKNSGLHLLASEKDLTKLGVGKAPVAAGKGSGGLLYDIVPGKPEESILQFRIESTHPGIMMPELGRSITHSEGVDLVRQWIKELRP